MLETLLKRGRCGIIYKIESPSGALIRKKFSPNIPVKLWNWLFYTSPHPASVEWGCHHAYWKRRLASRLSRYAAEGLHICDALRMAENNDGFIARFIEGRTPGRKEKKIVYQAVKKLEDFFDRIGMPTWSFSQKNPFSDANFILHGKEIHIVDYEQSVPVPDVRGAITYDIIYFKELHRFVESRRQELLNKLGAEEMKFLEEAFELARLYQSRIDIKPRPWIVFCEKKLKIRSRFPEKPLDHSQ